MLAASNAHAQFIVCGPNGSVGIQNGLGSYTLGSTDEFGSGPGGERRKVNASAKAGAFFCAEGRNPASSGSPADGNPSRKGDISDGRACPAVISSV